jgi:hypothetical protein
MVVGGNGGVVFVELLTTTIFPHKSPHAHHGAACSKSRMPVLGRRMLASVPHHKDNTIHHIVRNFFYACNVLFCDNGTKHLFVFCQKAQDVVGTEVVHAFSASFSFSTTT